jgi:hypothetical protein
VNFCTSDILQAQISYDRETHRPLFTSPLQLIDFGHEINWHGVCVLI